MTVSNTILTDGFGRKHNYLRISLLEKCNLRCTYCMPADGIALSPKANLMTADEIFSIAQTFVKNGVDKIRLTGGEPLLRKDFPEIVSKLSQLDISLSITTNGILIDRYIDVLKQFKIKKINLSLDTLVSSKFHTITLRNQFEKVIDNLHLLLNNDFQVKVNVVLMKGFNDNEIIDFVKLTQFLPISVRFIEFMPFAGNEWDRSKMVSQSEILSLVENNFAENEIVKLEDEKNFTSRNYKIKDFQGDFGIISSITNPFCDSCNRIRLTANGKIKNCLFSNSETDLLTPLRSGESITNLISDAILNKKKVRAGMVSIEEMDDPVLHFDNRSMIAIGG
ncbi:GTP 3',8-cyclase MoaA [Flavobacterium hibernum]|uniref:GTP 3',8-cyclase n=1 Tax=Flavobacterium hibernum TaxID=37752 RepID=A0A0D0EZ66_9FLAO|nr:GTP 3',8-cyclase MoaA [Flavobacterium hibernum]KIO50937.1 molybdenum cofactor biosynthesis protein MoeA [Flavobacterium hibernum]OXA84209.1 cyclic pyranopterin phosphate synthase MoaA [Flavobacterium hibernum]STO10976.1 Probable molybdopterin cofactor synthesis protein A [Flavobacterium hibernum]